MTNKETKHHDKKLTLISLTWPIFIELSLHMLMGNVDTFMLSQYDDKAVAAVGVSNQISVMFNLIFSIVATGTTILVSRYLGAKQIQDARHVATTSLTMNFIFGVLMSIVLVTLCGSFLKLLGLENELLAYGKSYLTITGSFLFLQALILTASATIKSYGFTRNVMMITVSMNIINIFGNAIFIYGWFGIPVLGVTGVAIATVITRTIGLSAMLYLLVKVIGQLPVAELLRPKKRHIAGLLRIGIPSAGENLSYNISQLVITSFIAMIGVTAMVTRVYTFNILFLITIFSLAISQSTQILVARMIGAGEIAQAYKRGLRSLALGVGVTILSAAIYNLLGGYILDLFTDDPEVIRLGRTLLLLAFVLEPGRAFNIILIGALRASGDVNFPVIISAIFVWGLAVPNAYLFGIHLEFGLLGIFIAFVIDEWVRGLIMLFRWRRRKWQERYLRTQKEDSIEIA